MIIQADAIEALKTLPPECIDLVVIDPAYASLEKYRAIGTTTRLKQSKSSSNEWFNDIFPNHRYLPLFEELFRVLKKNSHLYCFSDDETTYYIKPGAESVGFKYWKSMTWIKTCQHRRDVEEEQLFSPCELMNKYVRLGMGYHYRGCTERVMFFERGKRNLNNTNIPDALFYPRVEHGYPTEKPLDLVKLLINNSCNEGGVVLDCFAGAGTTGTAAASLGMSYILIDTSPVAIEEMKKRGLT